MVGELIDVVSGSWRRELVEQHFLPTDVPIILSIPLREDTQDFVACQFDPKGCFSVKSAYTVHVDM
jgi:hypothetical protein